MVFSGYLNTCMLELHTLVHVSGFSMFEAGAQHHNIFVQLQTMHYKYQQMCNVLVRPSSLIRQNQRMQREISIRETGIVKAALCSKNYVHFQYIACAACKGMPSVPLLAQPRVHC